MADFGFFGAAVALNDVKGVNVVHVNSPSEFPPPVAGVRTLADNTVYQVHGAINVGADRFVAGENTSLLGLSAAQDSVITTNAGAFITSIDTEIALRHLTISALLGTLLDVSHTAGHEKLHGLSIGNCIVLVDGIGIADDVRFCTITESTVVAATSGLLFTGLLNGLMGTSLSTIAISGPAPAIDFGISVWDGIAIGGTAIVPNHAGAVGISGAASSGNLAANGRGSVSAVTLIGLGAPIAGISQNDLKWTFGTVSDVQDSSTHASISVQGNALETAIATVDTPVKTNAAWVVGTERRFSAAVDGTITYTGLVDVAVTVFTRATVNNVGGGTDDLSLYLALNGTVLPESKALAAISAEGSISTSWLVALTTGDTIEQHVENNSDTSNIVVVDAVVVVG